MIYMDSAATSLLKPPSVGRSMVRALQQCASPGRGTHAAAAKAAETVYSCREAAAKLFHVPAPEQVIFTSGATHGLNLAIRSLVKPGNRVVVSGYEHNAVIRPLFDLGAVLDTVQTPLFEPEQMLDQFASRIPGAAAVVCTHVSNVFGYILPIEDIAALCRRSNVPLIVDAAQSAGVLDIDFQTLGAEYIIAPGHKGLLGPQGTGLLLCRNGGEPLLFGGTGSFSASAKMPEMLPDRLEAGTHNVCGIAGLYEGIRYVMNVTPQKIRQKEDFYLQELISLLKNHGTLDIYQANDPSVQCGVLSVVPRDKDCEIYADLLGKYGIAVRAGLHCAPAAHRTAGTDKTGTVRLSFSPFLSRKEIHHVAGVMKKI